MKAKNKLLRVALISLLIISGSFYYFSQQSSEDRQLYIERILEERQETDKFMRTSRSSPFVDSLKYGYKGLNYFAPNQDYRVQAIIIPIEEKERLIIPTSDGKRQRFEKHAFAEFKLNGARHRLLLLKSLSPIQGSGSVIFTAFADETTGNETYGGGRYLDLEFKNARQITIDFNLAYNPYCAYNPTFSCPLPPKENILPIPILAGEKNYD